MTAIDHDNAATLDDEQADLAARLLRDLTNPMPCRRCDGVPDSIRTCGACLGEIQMRDDDEAHTNECARYEAAWSALCDDSDEWGEL